MVSTSDHVGILQVACEALLGKNIDHAKETIKNGYPFTGQPATKRNYSDYEKLTVFVRDGFIDRYTGDRLVFPGLLRLLSSVMPDEFPYHPNAKLESCHFAYYELMPTLDHIVPVARHGLDQLDNWITASMISNSEKGHWTLEERRMKILPAGNLSDWDGLIGVFISLVDSNAVFLDVSSLKKYYGLAKRVLAEQSGR